MSIVAHKKDWPVVPVQFKEAPQEWPSPIHQELSTATGPSQNRLESFVAASSLRTWAMKLVTFNKYGDTFAVTTEQARRMALKSSGNLWYLEHQPYVFSPNEARANRKQVTAKGNLNGRWGVRYTLKNPVRWAPTAALALAYLYRYADLGTV
eukprot:NODE_5991_length_617_cov_40.172535_g5588_i0.p1 GENE.NODE_5991_length_617_cov_40.172535_g5588_i0~~NODE_5991_length_617_cov_40.172535_g5588_i0.p1  ORF type:complete len:174 (-),score=50.20 NODE_5991_length_617_cov_40.172535_g5588_i0:94-549(-)